MEDIYDVLQNLEMIHSSNTSFQILKDFERVLDEVDLYVYDNWIDGELASGPHVDRHWVTCRFFWKRTNMPDPDGGSKLTEYGCKVKFGKTNLVKPRKIRQQDDIRPGTKKGKLDVEPIWIVEIQMPKNLIADIYAGYQDQTSDPLEPAKEVDATAIDNENSNVLDNDTNIDELT